LVESDEQRSHPLRYRDVDCIASSQGEIDPPQKCPRRSDVCGDRLLPQRGLHHHASKAEHPLGASSGVMSPIRMRRATAEANSAAAKSLTIMIGVFV
jgi:hypothetical protein